MNDKEKFMNCYATFSYDCIDKRCTECPNNIDDPAIWDSFILEMMNKI